MAKSDQPSPQSKSLGAKSSGANTPGTDKKKIVFLPTLDYYRKTYAGSLGDNDQKAVRVFHDYESHEKLRRLQSELLWIKNGDVEEQALDRVVGKKRAHKYAGYSHWAELMMVWISQIRK